MESLVATSEVRTGLTARALRRHLPAMIACILAGLLLGAAYGELRPDRYTATAQVLLARPASDAGPSTPGDSARFAANELQVLSSESLLRAAEARAGYALEVEIAPVEGSDIADVSATAGSPLKAASDANGYAETYLDLRDGQERANLDASIAALEQRLDETQATVDDIDAQLAEAAGRDAAARDALAAQVGPTRESLVRQQAEIRDRIEDFALSNTLADSGARVTDAVAPTFSSSLSPALCAVLGMLLGGLAAVAVAVLLERRGGRVVDAEDVQTAGVDASNVVTVGARRDSVPIDAPDDDPAHVAAYRQVAAVLTAQSRGLERSVVGVVPVGWIPAGPLAGNMALSMSTLGRRVVVVDCTTDAPTLHRFFSTQREPGLTDVLARQATLDQALVFVRNERLALLSSGSGHTGLIAADVAGVLNDVCALADTVILALPDAANSATALMLASECSLAVVAVEHGVGQRELRATGEALRRVNLPAAAVVLIAASRSAVGRAAEDGAEPPVSQAAGTSAGAGAGTPTPAVAATDASAEQPVHRGTADDAADLALPVQDAAAPVLAPSETDHVAPPVTPVVAVAPEAPEVVEAAGSRLLEISPTTEPIAAAAPPVHGAELSGSEPEAARLDLLAPTQPWIMADVGWPNRDRHQPLGQPTADDHASDVVAAAEPVGEEQPPQEPVADEPPAALADLLAQPSPDPVPPEMVASDPSPDEGLSSHDDTPEVDAQRDGTDAPEPVSPGQSRVHEPPALPVGARDLQPVDSQPLDVPSLDPQPHDEAPSEEASPSSEPGDDEPSTTEPEPPGEDVVHEEPAGAAEVASPTHTQPSVTKVADDSREKPVPAGDAAPPAPVAVGAAASVAPSIAGPIGFGAQRVLTGPRAWAGGAVPIMTIPDYDVPADDAES